MTQEEKDLLIKDLSARLLYKVKFSFNLWNEEKQEEVNTVCTLFSVNTDGYCEALEESGHIPLEFIKPYLHPMRSMTEGERRIYKELSSNFGFTEFHKASAILVGWLNQKMFDYRGLIEKGLAKAAPEGMYST